MEGEFLFSKLQCGPQHVLCFAEFYEHLLTKTEFNVCAVTILLPDNINSTPIYQSKSASASKVLNPNIEWSQSYFDKIRAAFRAPNPSLKFKLTLPRIRPHGNTQTKLDDLL